MKHLFNRNMGNFKFNFLSRGQLGSKSIDEAFLTVFKMLPGMSASLVTLFLHLLLERSAEIILICNYYVLLKQDQKTDKRNGENTSIMKIDKIAMLI